MGSAGNDEASYFFSIPFAARGEQRNSQGESFRLPECVCARCSDAPAVVRRLPPSLAQTPRSVATVAVFGIVPAVCWGCTHFFLCLIR